MNPILRKRTVANAQTTTCRPSVLSKIDSNLWNALLPQCGDYFYNTPTMESINLAEMRIDDVRPWPKLDQFRAYAQVIADNMLEPSLTAEEWTDLQTLDHLDLKKGVGCPLKFCGFKTRDQLYSSRLWLNNFENVDFLKDLLPLYESVGKEELADMQDFRDKKSRTFQTTGAHLLYWQLRLYGQGNENLKQFKWSKYGFNPFYGGVNKWYKDLMVKDENGKLLYVVRICWDISGYDRKIYLHWVADRRFRFWKNANPKSKYADIAAWVRDAWKRSIIIFHNGDIVVRLRGNNSGSGTTTTNNIEAGFEVVADLLVYTYYHKYKELPPEYLITKQLIALYGDDNAMFLMEQFDLMLDENLVKQRLLDQHGLVCKWLVGGIEHPFNELQFLGFTIEPYWKNPNIFIPKWDIKRLVHPILYTPRKKEDWQYLQQVYSLLLMSFAYKDTYFLIKRIYMRLLQHYQSSGQPEIKFMINLGVPSEEDVEQFYLGFESESRLPIHVEIGGGGPLIKFNMISNQESKYVNGTRYECPDFCHKCCRIEEESMDYESIPEVNDIEDWSKCDPFYDPKQQTEFFGYRHNCNYCWDHGKACLFHGYRNTVKNYSNRSRSIDFNRYPGSLFEYDDKITKARIAKTPKHGVFNEYGNEMLAMQYTITKPSITTLSDSSFTCSSTCIFETPQNIVGTGDTATDAFDDWSSQVSGYLENWAPDFLKPIRLLVESFRKLPRPASHEFMFIWDYPIEKSVFTFWDMFKEGSFNKFGNGQPISLVQWTALNKKRLGSLNNDAVEVEYNKYLQRTKNKGRKPNPKPKGRRQQPVKRAVPQNKRTTGYEERAKINLSGCAKGYMTALRCSFWWQDNSCASKVPRGLSKDLPCIPMFPAIKTRKFNGRAQGTLTVTSTGQAFIMFAPWRLANDNANNTNVSCPILYSNGATSLGSNVFPLVDSGAAWVSGAASLRTDYTTANLVSVGGVGIRERIVGAQIRVKYIGPSNLASGLYNCVEQSDHQTLSALTLDTIGTYESFFSLSVDSQRMKKDPWVYLSYTPVDESDFQFAPDTIANATWSTVLNKNHFIGILITGAPVSGDFFNWEAIVHFEAIGQQVTGKTDTPCDPTGTAVATNSIKAENQKTLNTDQTVMQAAKVGTGDLSVSSMINTAVKTVQEVMPLVSAIV